MAPGDIVATFSDDLGEWTAAQIIALDESMQMVDVLDLNWSGPEPSRVEDLVTDKPLRGIGMALHREWILPRSHKIIGNAPLLRERASQAFGSGWSTGSALFDHRMRSRDANWRDPRSEDIGEVRLNRYLSDPDFRDPDLLHLTLRPGPVAGPVVDCERLVRAYPNVVSLNVWGLMARLANAESLNQLNRLRRISLDEVFGMTAADVLEPHQLPRLEEIQFESIPADYAAATRRAWKSLESEGVLLSVTKARRPEWVAQNLSNPLRGWDGRDGITARSYASARAAWNQVTPPIIEALAAEVVDQERQQRLSGLGTDFARAFNDVNLRSGFIETQERDELLDGLADLVGQSPTADGVDRNEATATLLHAVNQSRDW